MTPNTIPPSPANPPPDEFHLVSLPTDSDSTTASAAADAPHGSIASRSSEPVVLPAAVTSLKWHNQALALLEPHGSSESQKTPLLEPVTSSSGQPRLLVASPQERPVRVNGHPAPRITLLSEGDQFSFNGSCSWKVAIFHRPHLGSPPTESIGVACQICGTPVTADDRCMACSCGALYHAPLDEAAEGALVCVKMATECARCNRPIRTTPGYGNDSVLPEGPANVSQG